MSTDLEQLLRGASRDPAPVDPERLWVRGRRRRAVRRVAGGTSVLAVAAIAVIGAVSLAPLLGGAEPAPLAPIGQSEPAPEPAPETVTEPDAGEATDPEPDPGPEPEVDVGSEPDAAALADPCAEHVDRELEGFIAVVSPVSGQRVVDGEVQLVGCANVYEATVLYRLLDGGGASVTEGFTTATCGSGCVGEFREVIPVPGPGTWTLQAFTESAEDGSERDLTEVTFSSG
jgi:hypothetical protein